MIIMDWPWQIWEDILGFENCEFYIKRWPTLDGMPFEDALISFPDAIPCGVKVASCGGKIIMNPDDSYILHEGDEILVIAEDDDSYAPAELPMVLSFSSRNKDFKQLFLVYFASLFRLLHNMFNMHNVILDLQLTEIRLHLNASKE